MGWSNADHKKGVDFFDSFFCDPVGARTQDLQLRRLLLYPTELRNQYMLITHPCTTKGTQNPLSRAKVHLIFLLCNTTL